MNPDNNPVRLPLRDRDEAGRLLAQRLSGYSQRPDALVLALPRGGIVVGAEIASALGIPLFPFVVRKLGVPGREELAMGAITTGGMRLLNEAMIQTLGISDAMVEQVTQREAQELLARDRLYSRGRQRPDLKDKIAIVTDDGVATGSSIMLAVQALRRSGAGFIVVAVPLSPAQAISQLNKIADEVVCLAEPEPFNAVGQWYEDFHQINNHEVCCILDRLFARPTQAQAA
jgi:putative phosphoribosyl transferase